MQRKKTSDTSKSVARKARAMKMADIDYIKKICNSNFRDSNYFNRAQVMMKNIKPLKKACGDESEKTVDVPLEAIEDFVKAAVKKYDLAMCSVMVITDAEGGMTYHTGMQKAKYDAKLKKHEWLFTVHGDTVYEVMAKTALMAFITVKLGLVGKREAFSPSRW